MVLVSGKHRHRDEQQPCQPQRPCPRRKAIPIKTADDHGEDDVQRRCLVIRLVKACQCAEQAACKAIGERLFPSKSQRIADETHNRDGLGQQQLLQQAVDLRAVLAAEKRACVKQIQRPIRHDAPSPKWNVALPRPKNLRHVRAQTCQIIGATIRAVKHHAHAQQTQQTVAKAELSRGVKTVYRPHQRLRAKVTVKMPSSSINWRTLSKPAAATNWSISRWLRRRITHASPCLWLVRQRAIISNCGCHG